MNPEDSRAALKGHDVGCQRGEEAGLGVVGPGDLSEEALAREADQHRETQAHYNIEPIEELEVVLQCLAKANTRVEDYVLLRDPRCDRSLRPTRKIVPDLANHVFVTRVLLHALRLSEHVN